MSYSHKDEELRNQLEVHLAMLKHEGLIDVWHDRRITPGNEVDDTISDAIEDADLILLLVSPDFNNSPYCYKREMRRAMERHEAGEARVLPVILRHCEWQRAPFAKLLVTPTDGKPIRKWPDIDEAFACVATDIRRAVETVAGARPAVARRSQQPDEVHPAQHRPQIRSSNLRVRQTFTEADKDHFLDDGFEYIANFFEGSLQELTRRYSDIQGSFKRIDARKFTAVVYRKGQSRSRCRIMLGGGMGSNSITYSSNDFANDNSFNESMSVEESEQILHLAPLGLSRWGRDEKHHLSFEGAAEYYWSMFIEPLQR